jgi:hypothetical protein
MSIVGNVSERKLTVVSYMAKIPLLLNGVMKIGRRKGKILLEKKSQTRFQEKLFQILPPSPKQIHPQK